jgi:hypothetical protein
MTSSITAPIWTGHELDVWIFEINRNTGYPIGMNNMFRCNPDTDTPLLTYCFWQTVTISQSCNIRRIPSTDMAFEEIVPDQYTYQCTVNTMYCKIEEFNSALLFNRKKRFEIVFMNTTSGSGRTRSTEQNILYNSFPPGGEISGKENDILELTGLNFAAEQFFQYSG